MPSSPVSSLWPSLSQPPYSKYVSYNEDIKVEHKQADQRSADLCYGQQHGQSIKTVLIISVSFLCGIIFTYLALRISLPQGIVQSSTAAENRNFEQGYSIHWGKQLMAAVRRDDMAINLRNYTYRVHISGTQGNNRLRDLLKDQLTSFGHVVVKLFPYNVLLSYHDWERPNSVTVKAHDGAVVYQTGYHGPPIEDDPRPADHPELTEPYIAYSPNASVQGKLVYAWYGQQEDFKKLTKNGICCSNAIVLMKMGRVSLLNMVRHAELHGATGVLLFTDSSEAFDSISMRSTSRHLMRLPGWATQRGSLNLFGDPLTPGIPSREFMSRLPLFEADLPRIPVQSIDADDADQLLRYLKGSTGANASAGFIHYEAEFNLTERLPEEWLKNWTVQLDVFNELERREITNVFGIFRGSHEPDRYVIVGCHFDAWTFGGISPNTGTTVMMELVKALAEFKKSGWSPRRTIIFANWDAGEMGHIGAFEWIEDREQEIVDRTVSYIDVNSAVSGSSTLLVQVSPLMKELVIDSARAVPYEFPMYSGKNSTSSSCSGTTVLDAWLCHSHFQGDASIPRFDQVSPDSEHAPFYFYLGIPVIWPRFVNMNSNGRLQHEMPVFRTSVDTFEYVRQFVDPTFETHKAMVGLISEIVLRLSTMPRLSLDVHELSSTLEVETKDLCQRTHLFRDVFENLEAAVYNLSQTTAQFRNKFLEVDNSNAMVIRQYNDKVMQFSRSFVHRVGLPDRPLFRNLLFGPANDDYSQIRVWPRIQDVLDMITRDSTPKDLDYIHKHLMKEVSTAIAGLHSATYILDDMHL